MARRLSAVTNSTLGPGLDELLADRFVRDLHRRLYADIWAWAGVFRLTELSIGVAPERNELAEFISVKPLDV